MPMQEEKILESQNKVEVYFKRKITKMSLYMLTVCFLNLLLLIYIIIKSILPIVAAILFLIYLILICYHFYFYNKRMIFEKEGLTIHNWRKKDEFYPYKVITAVEVDDFNLNSSVAIYQENKIIARYNVNYENFIGSLSFIRQRGLNLFIKGGEAFDYVLPVPVPKREAEEFGGQAFSYLKENYEEVYNEEVKKIHIDYTLNFELEYRTADRYNALCVVYLMKNGSYTRLRYAEKKKDIPGAFTAELAGGGSDKMENSMSVEQHTCNVNYKFMLDGKRWKAFMEAIRGCEVILCEHKPALGL